MRTCSSLAFAALVAAPLAGCGGNHVSGVASVPGADMAAGPTAPGWGSDMARARMTDMGIVYTPPTMPQPGGGDDMAPLPPAGDDTPDGGGGPPGNLGDGGVFTPPAPPDLAVPPPPPPTPPSGLSGLSVLGYGVAFNDVSSDQGGGTWAASSASVYYWPPGAAAPFTYDWNSGLAQGHSTWVDDYYCAGGAAPTCPATFSVTFTSVAGGEPGQVVVGNLGYIADRLDVDPTTGEVRDVVGLQVTSTQQSDPSELAAQQQRVVASWKVALDLNGTFNGTAYLGGWHGLSAFHGFGLSRTTGVCGLNCGDFEEHVHPFLSADAAGRDIRAITITPLGDLWVGDADAVWFVAQRSQGPYNDFFSPPPQIPGQTATYLDVFPGVTDMVYGIATDAAGGVYVASYNNGLAYLAPNSYSPTYWSSADKLPSNNLTSVVVDGGDVWIGTLRSGVVRYTPASGTWTYYTQAGSGLPSDDVRALWTSTRAGVRTVYIATDYGIGVYTGP